MAPIPHLDESHLIKFEYVMEWIWGYVMRLYLTLVLWATNVEPTEQIGYLTY